MVTRASDPAACARRLGTSNRGKDPTVVIDVPESEQALGHLSTAPMPTRAVRPGIGALVCTINTTAEPGVLRGLLNVIMGSHVEESRVLHSRVRALPVDGTTM